MFDRAASCVCENTSKVRCVLFAAIKRCVYKVIHVCAYVYEVDTCMCLCVQGGYMYVPMCTRWIHVCAYVYKVDTCMCLCVRGGYMYVPMCTRWIHVCAYVYKVDTCMCLCVQGGYMYVPMCTRWIHVCAARTQLPIVSLKCVLKASI